MLDETRKRSDSRFDTSTPAVVLKLDHNPMHHGGLGIIRSLGRHGVPVYAVCEDALAPAGHSRYLRGRWCWRPPADDPERVLDGLARLARRLGRPAVLLPTDDAGAILLDEHARDLDPAWLVARPPTGLRRRLAAKHSLVRVCREHGVPSPESLLTASCEEAVDFADATGYPVVAKLAAPWRPHPPGARSTTILRTRHELRELFARCGQDEAAELMLQEFLPGGRGHDWFFHGYCDAGSRCRPAFTGLKERSYPAHAGLTSFGHCVDNPFVRSASTELLNSLGFRGIVDMDWRWDGRDRRYKLLDCNPRIGAQFRLFHSTAGIDVAMAAYLDLTGQPVPDGSAVEGRRFVVENYDPLSAWRLCREGQLGVRDWGRSLLGVDETAWFARDDLVPFGLMCLRMGWRGVTRRLGRRARAGTAALRPTYRPGRSSPRVMSRRDGETSPRRGSDHVVGEGVV